MATLQADHLSLPRQVETSAKPLKEARDALSRVSAAALRWLTTLQPFVQHDLLIAALVARGHRVNLSGGDAPHLVIDGVAASFAEAMVFHRGVVTLADIVEHGALSGNAPDGTLP